MSEKRRKNPVGARNRKGIRAEMEVPVNLERVLIEAVKDKRFYQQLVLNPARALDNRGYRLRSSEQAMLAAMPQATLKKIIDQLRPEKLTKSRFAKQVATAVAGTVLFSTSACESSISQGISPNFPYDASSEAGGDGTGGVGGSQLPDASPDGAQAGTGGASVWTPDTGPVTVDAGVSPNLLDANPDGNDQTNDAELPTWESDAGTVTRGITPDFPSDAANDSNDSEDQGAN